MTMGRMVDQTGLSERLQQHTRRSGMMVGISMAVVVVLLVVSFTWIFFRLDPFFSDFAGRSGVARSSPEVARVIATPRTGSPVAGASPAVDNGLPLPPSPTALAGPRASATAAFAATHLVADFGQQVNLRAGPSTTASRVALLTPGTRLMYLNEDQQVGDTLWMRFQTERGDTGWVRQLDTVAVRSGTPTPTPR
jgi:hypothetical protein